MCHKPGPSTRLLRGAKGVAERDGKTLLALAGGKHTLVVMKAGFGELAQDYTVKRGARFDIRNPLAAVQLTIEAIDQWVDDFRRRCLPHLVQFFHVSPDDFHNDVRDFRLGMALNAVRNNFGASALSSVPEPTTFAIGCVAMALVACFVRIGEKGWRCALEVHARGESSGVR